MAEEKDITPAPEAGLAASPKDSVGFSLSGTPWINELLVPIRNDHPLVNEAKIRRLYLQASQQQWFSPQKLNFTT